MARNIIIFLLALIGISNAYLVEFEVSVPRFYTPLFDDVFLAGSFNNWQTSHPSYKLTRQGVDDLYRITLDLPAGNYEFKFTRGGWDTTETTSSGNYIPNRVLSVTNNIKLKVAVQQWQDMKKGKNSVSGNVYMLKTDFDYPEFNSSKRIWIYLPRDYFTATSKRFSVVYMHDAQNLFDSLYTFMGQEWGIDETLERFASQGFDTSIVVGLENTILRMDELTPYSHPKYGGGKADAYLNFVVNRLKPYIDSKFRTRSDRLSTSIVGSSLGGLASFYAGLKYQSVFGKVGVFSPSFWFSEEIYSFASRVNKEFDDTKFYFLCGAQESDSMVSDMVRMVNIMSEKGFKKLKNIVKQDGQHSEWFWNREFPFAYEFLFYN